MNDSSRDLSADEALGKSALRAAQMRLMPLLLLLYFINYLDRNNVGFAKLDMSEDIGLSATAYGFGAGIFFIAYFLFELPSAKLLTRYGTRIWVTRILVSWGVVATTMALVQGPTSYAIVRFILGAAEAGFFPAIVYYLTRWFPARTRVSMMGIFVIAQPLSNGLGAPLSGLMLQMDGFLSLQGWQWMFILQGLPAVLLGLVTLRVLPDTPDDAKWLTPAQKEWFRRHNEDEHNRKTQHGTSFLSGVKNPRILAFAYIYFSICFGIYGLSFWLPTIVKEFGGLTNLQIGFIVLIPYAFATVAVWWWSRHSDRTGERVKHVGAPMILAAAAMMVSAFTVSTQPVVAMAAICVVAACIYSVISPFWELPAAMFTGAAAAAAIAAVNSLGALAGFVAPYAVGVMRDATGDARSGLALLAGVLAAGGIFCVVFGTRRKLGQVHNTIDEKAVR